MISITLFIPGTNMNVKFDRISEFHTAQGIVSFVNRQGNRIESSLPYILSEEKELTN